jgi:hypothetical protein
VSIKDGNAAGVKHGQRNRRQSMNPGRYRPAGMKSRRLHAATWQSLSAGAYPLHNSLPVFPARTKK